MFKMEKLKVKLIIALILLAIIIAISLLYNPLGHNKDVQPSNKQQERDFYIDNCNCLKHNIKACSLQGYEYYDGACRLGGNITNPVLKCSKYDCDGQIINVGEQFWNDSITK